MSIAQKIAVKMSAVAEGNPGKRAILTPVMAVFFLAVTSLFILVPVWLERFLGIPPLILNPVNYIISLILFIPGVTLFLWTLIDFIRSKGTPAPINPPKKLITNGPYAYSRNPMVGGIFLIMFSIGVYYGSLLAVFVFIPIYMLIHIRSLSAVEEPELEKRFGQDYTKYKENTPRFLGWRKKI